MPLVISDSYINYKEAITPLPPALVPGTASSTSASEPPLAKSRPALVDSAILPPSLPIQAESVSAVSGYFSPASEELVSIKDPSLNRFKIRTPNILPNMHHIDRKELYTSLEARIQYLHSFLDFNADDVQALVLGSKYIKSLIPAVVNIVYKKLLKYDITARAFTTRSTSYEGPVDEIPEENSPQIRYRKMFLRGYLQKLCSDPSKYEFWEYLDKVGMMHVGMGRKHPLHIEYIHIGVCLGFIQDVIFEAILSHPRLRNEQKTVIIKALGKVLWIQNDLFAKWYVRDGEEFKDDMDEVEIEEDGLLHGKRFIDPASVVEEDESENGASSAGCPFASMMGDISLNSDPKINPHVIPHMAPKKVPVTEKVPEKVPENTEPAVKTEDVKKA